jgi:uncharacterized protein
MNRALAALLLLGVSSTIACGILDPRPDPSRFFVLASLEELGKHIDACSLPANVRVGLGPVQIPEYLSHPELATRSSPTELTRSHTERWSEPLASMLPRVLADDLTQLFRGGADAEGRRVVLFPWYSTDRPDWQIEVDVVRFEPDRNGEATLIARWKVHELGGGNRSIEKESRIATRAESEDPEQRALAMSAALGELADELAQATCRLATSK